MFSRRHYREVAAIIYRQMIVPANREAAVAFMNDMADMFARDNARFDRQKFVEACTESEGGKQS